MAWATGSARRCSPSSSRESVRHRVAGVTSTSHDPRRGRLLVLAGPSGVGKSSVVAGLRAALPTLYFSVSATTRDPRAGEVDGRDYRFVGPAGFDELIARGELLEWAEIHGGLQRSGTPRAPVEQALDAGRPVLVEVDLQGARAVKAAMPEAVTGLPRSRRRWRSWSGGCAAAVPRRRTLDRPPAGDRPGGDGRLSRVRRGGRERRRAGSRAPRLVELMVGPRLRCRCLTSEQRRRAGPVHPRSPRSS